MSQFISQYFDVNFMLDHFGTVFKAFTTLTLELFLISGILSLIWGLILSLLRRVDTEVFRRNRDTSPADSSDVMS